MLICAVFDLGLVGYFLVPTAPPWWAAEQGTHQGYAKDHGGRRRTGLGPVVVPSIRISGRKSARSDAVPAFRHFADGRAVLADFESRGRRVGWAYAATLGFALVYLGEHYVVDLVAGAALTEGIRAAAPRAAPAARRVVRTVAGSRAEPLAKAFRQDQPAAVAARRPADAGAARERHEGTSLTSP